MKDTERKEESWIQKLPVVIVILAVLIFIVIVIRDHNQYTKWKEEQANLTGKVSQTSGELALLREANGTLDDVTKKVQTLEQQTADLTAALEMLTAEKNKTDSTLTTLRRELSDLNEWVSAGRTQFAELTQENETLIATNQRLRNDIVNKKSVLESTAFLQRQKPVLEQKIQDLKARNDLALKAEHEQQARLEDLQNKIKERETDIQSLTEQRTALTGELSGLTETVKKLSLQKEKLETWDDHQRKLEYLEYLQQQKESLERSINDLLETGKKLEKEN